MQLSGHNKQKESSESLKAMSYLVFVSTLGSMYVCIGQNFEVDNGLVVLS